MTQLTSTNAVSLHDLEIFFSAVGIRVENERKRKEKIDLRKATRFNIFSLIDPDENKLSDILKDLLDPKGTHGQGALFLQLFFKSLQIDADPQLLVAAKIHRETQTYGISKFRRRIDVMIDAAVCIAMENKVDSPDQEDQIKDYLEHLGHPWPKFLFPSCRPQGPPCLRG
ncbi:MAG TPA: PD-(D/E)XK nuclease family protein [Verrucomicrobiae bacterium]|jgi:hypothetical protein|nr:PD-(D/E)XK nuclease family protein [Verrucomicrobiae bacterium]